MKIVNMNYIGSKNKLCSFIEETILNTYQSHISNAVFCDLFAGTGIVGRAFKKIVKQIISNDKEFYSYVLNKNYISNHLPFEYQHLINELNHISLCEGFIFNEYSENGKKGRLYFNEHNGKKIDAIRQQIEKWKNENVINENVYFFY